MTMPLLELPKFSAIVTCYNYERYVAKAIESVASQVYSNFECIIVDDASTDGSVDVIRETIARLEDKRFRLISLDKNIGQTEAGLRGLDEAAGDFVAFLDADDWWTPDFVSLHIAAHLNELVNVGVSCCDMIMIDAEDRQLARTIMSFQKGRKFDGLKPKEKLLKSQLRHEELGGLQRPEPSFYYFEHGITANWRFAPMSAMVFRRALLNNLRPPPDWLGGKRIKNVDYIYAMIASTLTGWIAIDTACCTYRLHTANMMSSNPLGGGVYWMSGFWSFRDTQRMYNHNEATIVKNYQALKSSYGHWFVMLTMLRLGSVAPLRCFACVAWMTIKYLVSEKRISKQD